MTLVVIALGSTVDAFTSASLVSRCELHGRMDEVAIAERNFIRKNHRMRLLACLAGGHSAYLHLKKRIPSVSLLLQ